MRLQLLPGTTARRWLNGTAVPSPQSFCPLVRVLYGSKETEASALLHTAWERARRRGKTPPVAVAPIPPQRSGPHFGLGSDYRLRQIPPYEADQDGNDTNRINSLLPMVRQVADALSARITPAHNHYPFLGKALADYRTAIAARNEPISWGAVWGYGLNIENYGAAAERQVGLMQDPMEHADQAALQSLRSLHAALIVATAEGRELQARADRNRMTRGEQAARRDDAITVATALKPTAEPAAATVLTQAAEGMGQGHHPERGTEYGLAVLGNAATLAIAGAVVAAAIHSEVPARHTSPGKS